MARKLLMERLELLESLAANSTAASIAALTDPSKACAAVQRCWDLLQVLRGMRLAVHSQ